MRALGGAELVTRLRAILLALAGMALVAGIVAIVAQRGQPKGYLAPAFTVGDAKEGWRLTGKYQCYRCHAGIEEGPRVVERPSPKPIEDCDDCHTQIEERPWQDAPPHYRNIPSLAGAAQLFRPEWLVSFLAAPTDLRPHLEETMPHLGISRVEAENIVAHLTDLDPPDTTLSPGAMRFRVDFGAWTAGDALRGKALYEENACFSCHTFTGADVGQVELNPERPGVQRAPDLRYTRDRFRPDRIVDWLVAPRHHRPATMMPDHGLSVQQARDLAAFVFDVELDAAPSPPPVPRRLPLLDRPVAWNEVYAEVFGHTCIHCHGDPAVERADGGPGYAGGFGIRRRRLSFADYENALAGSLDDVGRPRSIFAPLEDGTPRLLAHLLARRLEVAGREAPVRGMPLGLPPLTPVQIQLVETWIAQGYPRNLPIARTAVNIRAR